MKSTLLSALRGLHQQKIFNPAANAFILRILGAVFQFLFTLLLARLYGATGVGIFIIALSILVVTSTIVRWGLDQTTLKLVAANIHQDDGSIQATVTYTKKVVLLSGIAGTAIVMLSSDWLANIFFGTSDMSLVILLMSAAIIPLSLTTLYAEALRGLKRVNAYTMLHGVMIPLLSILLLLLYRFWNDNIVTGAAAYLSASIFAFLFARVTWKRTTATLKPAGSITTQKKHEIFNTTHALAWIAIVSVAMSFTETFILSFFHDEVSVGLYAAALRLALIPNFIIIAFNSILAPNFASLYQQKKTSEIEALIRQSVLVMFALTLPVVMVFVLFPASVLSIFGQEFEGGSTALILLSIGQLINIIAGPVGILLQMSGHEKSFRNNVLFSAAITLILAILLIPPYKVLGASLSAVIGILILNVLSVFSVYRKLGINSLPIRITVLLSGTKS